MYKEKEDCKTLLEFVKKYEYPAFRKRIIELHNKELDNRDRIHTINLECARQGAKKEVFRDINKIRNGLCREIIPCMVRTCTEKIDWFDKSLDAIRKKHLNTSNTESENEGNSLPYDGEGYSEGQIDCEMKRKKEGKNGKNKKMY